MLPHTPSAERCSWLEFSHSTQGSLTTSLELSWRNCFTKNPCERLEKGQAKIKLVYANSISKTKKSLWICGFNPSWVHEELGKQDEYGKSGMEMKGRLKVNGVCKSPQSYEKVSNGLQTSQGEALHPVALVAQLKVCTIRNDLNEGSRLHTLIDKRGLLQKNAFIGNTLINMYAKCGAMHKALEVFEGLAVRNVVSWNALIGGYVKQGCDHEALACLNRMQGEGVSPDAVTFISVLKACGRLGALEKGQDIHDQIIRDKLLKEDTLLGTALVDMYAKCSLSAKARQVFEELPVRDIVSWNALITGYLQGGHVDEALKCYELMQSDGFSPSAIIVACMVKACGSLGDFKKAQEVHTTVVKEGRLEKDNMVANTLIDMYGKFCLLEDARKVFDELHVRDIVSWTALIGSYAQHEYGDDALVCFERMLGEGFSPDALTFTSILKACGCMRAADKGQELHAEIVKCGFLEKGGMHVGTAVVDMYASCGMLLEVKDVFEELEVRDVVAWTALITSYAEVGHGEESLQCFDQMQLEGLSPNAVTFICVLRVCGNIRAIDKGEEVHSQVKRYGLLDKDVIVGNAVVEMYAKCGLLSKAQEAFDELVNKNVITWTSLISGYVQHGYDEEALNAYERMLSEGFIPDAAVHVSVLKASSSLGGAYKGQEVHMDVVKDGSLEKNTILCTGLVDMYVGCGMVAEAQEVFDELRARDTISWNALLVGYSQLGKDEVVFTALNRMREECKDPDSATYNIVLNACSQGGLLDKGQAYFEAMTIPLVECYSYMVDLFGRSGQLLHAVALIENMPFPANSALWLTLLSGCQRCGNKELGSWVFTNAEEKDAALYVCMSNIYASGCGKRMRTMF